MFKEIGELIGKGVRDIIEIPIDISKGLYDGISQGGLFKDEPERESDKLIKKLQKKKDEK